MSIEEIALEAEERMEKSVTLLTDQLRGIRTGRANVGPGRLDPGRLLRLVDAAQADGQPEHARAAADPDPPVRPLGDRRHRQGDPDQRPGPDAQLRRQGGPPERPAPVGRAAQEAGQPRQGARRGGPRRDPQHPPRRQQAGRQEQTDKILTEDDLATCKEEIQILTKKFEAKVNELADKKSAEIMEV